MPKNPQVDIVSRLLGSKILLGIFTTLVLCLTVRGLPGNPTSEELLSPKWMNEGPFELSPERGRFALLYSLVEDHSFFFSVPIARFATPDLGFANNRYVSLFAPGVSFLIAIGYVIGRDLGAAQVGAFAVISFFAVINSVLIRSICLRLGTTRIAATLAGILFVFATPAFSYAGSLYQHHISTFLILCGLYVIMRWQNFTAMAIVTLLFGSAIPIDYPNLILMLPVAVFAFTRFFQVHASDSKLKLSVRLSSLLGGIAIILPLLFFLWFNYHSYANPWQLSGTVRTIRTIDSNGNPVEIDTKPENETKEQQIEKVKSGKSASGFFKTRNLLNGLYLQFVSSDRGIIYYTPVILLGIFGAIVLYKSNSIYLWVIVGVIGFDVLLYAMWGDPWGGWAFGSRYLIPAYSMGAILCGVALTAFRKKALFLLLFASLLFYSFGVNTLGAITTNLNPPQVEITELQKITGKIERYSYDRNWEFLNRPASKSFFYQTIGLRYLTTVEYFWLITVGLSVLSLILILALRFT